MTSPSKRKGDKAELEVQAMLRDNISLDARRALGAGRKDDMGDIDGIPRTVIQVTNMRSLASAVKEKLPELRRQMRNADADYGALFCRRYGGDFVVIMTPEMWYAYMRDVL